MALNEGIELKIFDGVTNPRNYLDTLINREEPKYSEPLGDTASGSFVINASDPQTLATPSLLDYRNVVKVSIDGEIQGAFLITGKKEATIADEEKSAEQRSITGTGLLTWFDDATIYPETGLTQFAAEKRYFNFGSKRGDWYDDSKWKTATVRGSWGDQPFGPRPDDWPDDHSAQWVSTGPNGAAPDGAVELFRFEFPTGVDGQKWTFYGAGDDYLEMWLDGEKIINTDYTKSSIDSTTKVEVNLASGQHVLAARVTNISGAHALMSAFYLDHDDTGWEQISQWTGHADPYIWRGYYLGTDTPTPVWTPGEILLTLMAEGAARGIRSMGWMTPSFTSTQDSNGEPWLTIDGDWEFTVGDTLTSVIKQFKEQLGYYTWIDPDTLELHIGLYKGTDRTVDPDAIVFEAGKNLRKAELEGVAKIKNGLITKTSEGWLIDDSTKSIESIQKYGLIEGSYSADLTSAAAKSLMPGLFGQYANPEEGATYEITSLDDIPWDDFVVGDTVLAPNNLNLQVSRLVVSISVEEDSDTGLPLYTLEFDTIFQSNEERMALILKNLSGGVGGTLSSSSGSGSTVNQPVLPPPRPQAPVPPKAPTDLEATSDGLWTSNGVTPITTVHLSWSPVTLNVAETPIAPLYYEVWGTKASDPEGMHSLTLITSTTADITPLVPNEHWIYQVRALMDIGGPYSAFSDSLDYAGDGPSDPLPAPSTPSLSSSNGLLNVAWDGLLNGAQPAPQFRYVYAQIGLSSAGPWSIAGQALQQAGDMNIPGLTVGQEYWVRLFAVDGLTIISDPSPLASITIVGVDLGDLGQQIEDSIAAVRTAISDVRENVNMLEDSSFELNTEEYWDWDSTRVTNVTTNPRTGLRHLRAVSDPADYTALKYVHALECDPGQSFYLRVYARVQTGASIEGGLAMTIWSGDDDTTSDASVEVGFSSILGSNYMLLEGNWTADANTRYFRPGIVMNDNTPGRVYYIDDIRMFIMDDETTIVDGSINADKLAAESVVAGKIAAQAVATENLQAGSIIAELIAVDAITAEKILAGSVTTDKIAAGSITTNLLSPTVGNDLDISANNTVTIIAGQIQDVASDANATDENLQQMQTYYSFGPNGAVVSSPSSPFAVGIRNDRIEMLENGNSVSYWNSGTLYVDQFQGTKVILGNHQLEKYNTGTVVRAI